MKYFQMFFLKYYNKDKLKEKLMSSELNDNLITSPHSTVQATRR